VDASDLGKISPFGGNDKFVLPVRSLIFARDILTLATALPRRVFGRSLLIKRRACHPLIFSLPSVKRI
jgi:hypothetical protein